MRIDPADRLLASGLDVSQPFTTENALAAGLEPRSLHQLVDRDVLRRPLHGVYLATAAPESLDTRLACVRLVLPPGCVITDRTAAWLHGAEMVLAPGDHLVVPRVSAYHLPHRRLRNSATDSGARRLAVRDVIDLGGVPVTTPLRTACDLGRLLHRDSAIAALDSLLRLGEFGQRQLIEEVERFRGFRGVRQLRAFAPWTDAGSESYGESVLRLRWREAGLGVDPTTQILVQRPSTGQVARLDLGCEEHRFAAEYDGAAFHGPDQAAHDDQRRSWIQDELGWTVGVYRREHVFGHRETATSRLRDELSAAKVANAVRARVERVRLWDASA